MSSAPSLPPELLLEVIDHLSAPLSFPDRPTLRALLSLCLTSRAAHALAAQSLYSAIALRSPSAFLLLAERGVPNGLKVRALFLCRQELEDTYAPAERLVLSLEPTLERVVFDRHSPHAAPLDAHLAVMPRLQEVAFIRQATELLGLEPTYLEPCMGVRKLALHDYWMDEYHARRICACFPDLEELVFAADVSVQLILDVLDACPRLRTITIIRPHMQNRDWHRPFVLREREEARRQAQERREKPEVGKMLRERGGRICELTAPGEVDGELPNWEADCITDGRCWALEGVEWS